MYDGQKMFFVLVTCTEDNRRKITLKKTIYVFEKL